MVRTPLVLALLSPASGLALVARAPPRAAVVASATLEAPAMSSSGLNTELKLKVLQLAAALDRGQSYNPTSSGAYSERMAIASGLLEELIAASPPLPTDLAALDGEWELSFTDVAHGIFRSSPFFLAIQDAYASAGAPEKGELFFKLHELQTCSWGVSKIGRVAQVIDSKAGMLYSEFDTNLFALTVIPILGWFKLLPTFGGCVVTASSCALGDGGKLDMEVKYTTSRPVAGLSGLRPVPGDFGRKIAEAIWSIKVPVGAVWQLLPWNKGPPTCSVQLVYFDGDFRVNRDAGGQLFVYTRAVAPRGNLGYE